MDNLEDYNVIFITMDSCRFDTIQQANMPFLKSISDFDCAHTYATFTLPSHMSMFTGYLPKLVEPKVDKYYSRGGKQLWRLNTARNKDSNKIGLLFEAETIIDGYKKLGFFTLGVGGVRWFRSPILQERFDHFLFWGQDDKSDVFTPRNIEDLPLSHIDEISEILNKKSRWFFFLNTPETHVPYDYGYGLSETNKNILDKVKPLWGGKEGVTVDVSSEEWKILHKAQIEAVENLDVKIKELVSKISGKKIVVICSDHGEVFGEDGKYGHGFPHKKVFEVPMWVAQLD